MAPKALSIWPQGHLIIASTSQNNERCQADENRSALISVTADALSIGSLLVTPIFRWGVVLSLLRRSYVLPWLGTMPGAAHPKTRGSMIRLTCDLEL